MRTWIMKMLYRLALRLSAGESRSESGQRNLADYLDVLNVIYGFGDVCGERP